MLKSVPMNTLNEILKPNANSENGSNQTDLEWKKCRKRLLYYLSNYVYIQDSVNQEIIQWKSHPHLLQLINPIQKWSETYPRKPLYIIIFKSRQVYTTTTLAGIANWLCTFFESSRVLELSKKETDAGDFLGKSKFINDQHPDFLRLKLDPDQASLMGFPATHSRIRALPSTEDAGRSTDATMVVNDEWEFFPLNNAESNFAAVKPTIDKGGIFIGASTVDVMKMDSFAKKIYAGAKAGENNFIAIFWDYFVVSDRTEETWIEHTKGLADWQKQGEYPRSEKEALSPPETTCFFNRDPIADMMEECVRPIKEYGRVRIYKYPVSDRKYVFVVDSSEGQDDPAVGIVSDMSGEYVACFNGKMSLDEQAKIIYELYQEYNEPLIAIENNASGMTLIEKLKNMGVENWYYQDEKKTKEGWRTTGTASGGGNRPIMLNEHAADIANRMLRIPMKDALNEYLTFSWVDGKPQAIRGAHDDWVMCGAILGQVRKAVPVGNMKVTSFKYR